jgi:hypothetical protein
VQSSALLQGDQAQNQTAAPKTLCFLFCFAVLPQVRSSAPTCAIECSTRQQLRQFVSFSFYFWFLFSLVILISFYFYSHVGRYSNTYGPCSFCYDPYHHVRNCPSIRQISNNIFGHKKTSLSRSGNDNYFDSYNPTWSQQSNISWQAQDPGIHAPQFHGLLHQSYQQFYDHTYSCQSAPQQQYQAEPPPPEVSEELLETIKEMTQNTQQFFEEMRALRNKQAGILKEEEEEAYQEKPSSTYWPPQCQEEEPPPIYDHSYSHQQYQEEPPSLAMVALQEAMVVSTEMSAALERTMSAFLI